VKCKNCKSWSSPLGERSGRCQKIVMFRFEEAGATIAASSDEDEDGESIYAYLITSSDFGCLLGERR
jgi:hypothetical protein